MLRKILVLIAVVVVGFVVVAAMQPDDFRITRSGSVNAPVAAVFAQVNDLHKWQEWSPWAKLDPAAKNTYAGPVAGVGAALSWDGNNEVGQGTMTIVESQPNDRIQFRLDFLRPFAATNMAEFTFKAEGEGTLVTWSMSGTNNLLSKAVGLIIDCDKMVGDQFEKGLVNLKGVTEAVQNHNK